MQRKLRAFYESWERDEDVIRELSQGDLQDINNFFTSSKHSTENAESEDDDAFLDDSRIEELVKLAERMVFLQLKWAATLCLVCLLSEDKLEEQHLTAKELKLFHSALKRGKLDKEVESWSPWWHQVGYKRLNFLTCHTAALMFHYYRRYAFSMTALLNRRIFAAPYVKSAPHDLS